MQFEDFCKALNESKWRGWIHEVGFGLPLQASYLDVPGASATIISTGCLYDKSVQGLGSIRSVSREGATRFAAGFMEGQLGKLPESYEDLFSIAVSGAHKTAEKRGDSHAWISLITVSTGFELDGEEWNVHVTFDKDEFEDRKVAGQVLAQICQDLMCSVFKLDVWTVDRFIRKYRDASGFSVDVVSNHFPGNCLTLEQQISLAGTGKPVFIREGKLVRPTDILREKTTIYRGSFNPPTKSHDAIGGDAIYEIVIYNARKGMADLGDVAHRVRMLNAMGKTVMITYSEALFSEIDFVLRRIVDANYSYIVGVDTFNAVVDPKWYDYYPYELETFKNGSRFIVAGRDDAPIKKTVIAEYIQYERLTGVEYDHAISSSRVRGGESNLCPESVQKYIADNKLINYPAKS
jgi:nicotinic acid mononucleotide adenylyltransferase